MTPALITAPTPGQLDVTRLSAVDTAALRDALRDGLRMTVSHLVYVAAIWKELESRGEDLSALRQGIGAFLPAIAAGEVLPETVVAFAGKPATLKVVAKLPPAEQRAIADGTAKPPEVRFRGANARPALTRKDPVIPGMPARPAPAGEPSDEDLDRACEARQPAKPLDMLAAMIANAGPRDAAEMVADCVRRAQSPALVARQLIPLLEQLVRTPDRPKLVV